MPKRDIVAVKFGGSSFADHRCFADAADYLLAMRAAGHLPVAVVSAPKGVTDMLLGAVKEGTDSALNKLGEKLRERYRELLGHLSNEEIRKSAAVTVEEELEELRNTFALANKDAFLSRGESHSGMMLSAFLDDKGCKSTFVEGYETGIAVNRKGTVVESETLVNLRKKLETFLAEEGDTVLIVGGFVARCRETGEHRLMGRNSTDVTGSLVGAALGASWYEIIKDVPGIYRAGDDFRHWGIVERMCYDEATEVLWRGARVVHPMAIKYSKRAKVPIRVKNISEDGFTEISDRSGTSKKHPIAAIAPAAFYVVSVMDALMNADEGKGYMGKIADFFVRENLNILDIATSADTISMTFQNGDDLSEEELQKRLIRFLEDCGYQPEVRIGRMAAVSITGEALARVPGTLAKITRILGEAGVNIEIGSQSDERMKRSPNMVFCMEESDLPKAVDALCRNYFANE